MVDRLTVDPADLLRSAEAHEQRAAGWRRIRDTPPHDPDQLAQDLGFVGHAFVETIRHVRNPQRARDADNLASGYAKDAHALRAGAADYLGSDQASAVGITGSFEGGRSGEAEDRLREVGGDEGRVGARPFDPAIDGQPMQPRGPLPGPVPDARQWPEGENAYPPAGTGAADSASVERQDRATVQALGAGDSVRLPGVEPTAPTGPAPTPPPPPMPPNSARPR